MDLVSRHTAGNIDFLSPFSPSPSILPLSSPFPLSLPIPSSSLTWVIVKGYIVLRGSSDPECGGRDGRVGGGHGGVVEGLEGGGTHVDVGESVQVGAIYVSRVAA